MPRLAALSLSTPPVAPQPPAKEEISPVVPLEPPVTIESDPGDSNGKRSSSPQPQPKELTSSPETRRQDSNSHDDDIHSLDDEGWARVAQARGIEELLLLGEGISGSVCKCRLRKSGQVFAIKVYLCESVLC
jgi:hypothetical protein